MKTINGNLVLDKDTVFEGDVHVEGSIFGVFKLTIKGNLTVGGGITAGNITAEGITVVGGITAWDITAWDITAENITAWDITAKDITSRGNITAGDISYYAFCVAYWDITCTGIRGRHRNSFHKSLNGKIKIVKEAAK